MAADKKKSGEKVSKKAAEKSKPKPKAPESCPPVDPAHIVVPKGGQVIQFYELTPAFPEKNSQGVLEAKSWKLVPQGSKKPIAGNISVGFHENDSKLERRFERAILVIKMSKEALTSHGGTWRFALGGVSTDLANVDPDDDVRVEIIDNGLAMLVYVHVLQEETPKGEHFGFRFVASFANSTSGVVNIYESKDPGFIPKRPL